MQANNQESSSAANTRESTVITETKKQFKNRPGEVLCWAYEHYLEFDLPAVEKTMKNVCCDPDEAMVLYKKALLDKVTLYFTGIIMG